MAFPRKKIGTMAQFFGIDDDQMERACGRMAGYLAKHGVTPANVLTALYLLKETVEEYEHERRTEGFVYHFQNPKFRKYETEVVKLFQDGYGAKRISDAIIAKKGPRIPKTTIERFLSNNRIKRG